MQARVQQIVGTSQVVLASLLIPDEREILGVSVTIMDEVVEGDELKEPLEVHGVSRYVFADQFADFFIRQLVLVIRAKSFRRPLGDLSKVFLEGTAAIWFNIKPTDKIRILSILELDQGELSATSILKT